jgi:2-polyprenyl-6-methoxyphenol hydroxylase-like FAD-dependent oxidoreductase
VYLSTTILQPRVCYICRIGHHKMAASMPGRPPTVLIAGGSIMGLSLALMLDRMGIDYLLLEARESVTPQVGAGVICNANGFRILDQLGVHDDFIEQGKMPLKTMSNWNPDGTLVSRDDGMSKIFEQALGYPMVALDRQQALQIFYDHLSDKTKVVTGMIDTDGNNVTSFSRGKLC